MAETPRTVINNWDSYWSEPGSMYVLTYRPPPSIVCKDDSKVYSRVMSIRGLTGITRGLATPSDTPWLGYRRFVCYDCTRIPEVPPEMLECWVIVTEAGTLGRRLQPRLQVCEGIEAAYELTKAERLQVDSNVILRSLALVKDKLETPGESLGDLAGKGLGAALSEIVEALLPLAVPAAVAFIIYRSLPK